MMVRSVLSVIEGVEYYKLYLIFCFHQIFILQTSVGFKCTGYRGVEFDCTFVFRRACSRKWPDTVQSEWKFRHWLQAWQL
jgi:hypothetical protein